MPASTDAAVMLELVSRTPATTLAVAGCSKNAGKTTAMNVLTALWDETVGLMSIGIDGEDADFWLGVPKPRISVRKGFIFATAERALGAADAGHEIIARTGISTPLGELVLCRTTSAGMVLLAGIRHKDDVIRIRRLMLEHGATRVVVDGAYQRMAAADPEISDGLILATGAILGRSVDEIVAGTMEFAERLLIPAAIIDKPAAGAVAISRNGMAAAVLVDETIVPADSPGPSGALALAAGMGTALKTLVVPGSVPQGFCDRLIRLVRPFNEPAAQEPGMAASSDKGGPTLLVRDSTRLFTRNDELFRFMRKGGTIAAIRPVNLVALAVNPYSVLGYTVPSDAIIDRLAAALTERGKHLPVIDFVAAAGLKGSS